MDDRARAAADKQQAAQVLAAHGYWMCDQAVEDLWPWIEQRVADAVARAVKDDTWKAHVPVTGTQQDPARGLLHGCCERCRTPWPCQYSPERENRQAEEIVRLKEANDLDVINGEAWVERAREAEKEIARLRAEALNGREAARYCLEHHSSVQAAVAAERERCAEVVDERAKDARHDAAEQYEGESYAFAKALSEQARAFEHLAAALRAPGLA